MKPRPTTLASRPALPRRQMLAALAATAATVGWAPRADAQAARAADFAAAAASDPRLMPLAGVTDATGSRDAQATLLGRWPDELTGRFHRNGPALLQRAGERYHHWFDGDGMVQQFRIGGGQVLHRGRLVQTAKLQAERAAGRLLRPAMGTVPLGAEPVTGPDSVNTANTSALVHAGRLLALWEGGSAHALDPETLDTLGPVRWRSDLDGVPFSAHPKVDAQGHLWNVGVAGHLLVVWHVAPDGRLAGTWALPHPLPAGMVHDMAVTAHHLVLPLPPLRLDFASATENGRRRFPMLAGEPLRVLVLPKADPTQARLFELPPQMLFHVGNAHETADGHIVLSYAGAPDAWFMDEGAVALMAGRPQRGTAASPWRATLDLRRGSARAERLADEDVEFPQVHPARVGLPARWLVMAARSGTPRADGREPLLHAVQLLDTHSGRVRQWDYGPHCIAEEHVCVPKPGRSGELDTWLLGTCFDARRQATVLNLLDTARLEDGPVAQAVLPYALPLGFHGHFSPG